MDVTNALLVAMMFVIVLSLGIGNILTMLAGTVDTRSRLKMDRLHTSWVILLLLMYLDTFWQTLSILEVESWEFGSFLYMITGPILMLLATSTLLPDPSDIESLRTHYFGVARRFFQLMALTQVWVIGADIMLGDGFAVASTFNVIFGGIAILLAWSPQVRLHTVGTAASWVLFLAALVLRGVGVR